MPKNIIIYSILLLLLVQCKKKQNAQINYVYNTQHISVLTLHNNNYRTGWNSLETKLTTSNVNANQFGKLFTLKVDDQVYAQPLVAGNLNMDNQVHNVVYVATVNNSIYAFDGDNGNLFWQKNYTAGGMRAPRNTDMTGACGGGNKIAGIPVKITAAYTGTGDIYGLI